MEFVIWAMQLHMHLSSPAVLATASLPNVCSHTVLRLEAYTCRLHTLLDVFQLLRLLPVVPCLSRNSAAGTDTWAGILSNPASTKSFTDSGKRERSVLDGLLRLQPITDRRETMSINMYEHEHADNSHKLFPLVKWFSSIHCQCKKGANNVFSMNKGSQRGQTYQYDPWEN